MTDAPSVPWLLLGPRPYLATCTRCGGRIRVSQGHLPPLYLAKEIDAAIALHAGCLEPPEPGYVDPWGVRHWDSNQTWAVWWDASDTHTRP